MKTASALLSNKGTFNITFIFIYLFGVRLHRIDRRKLERNTGLPVLWIPL